MSSGAGTLAVGTLILGALVLKGIDLVKYVVAAIASKGKDNVAFNEALNGILTLTLGCGVGIAIVFTMAATTWSGEIKLGDRSLSEIPVGSLIVLGLVVTSIAGVLFDGKKALDNNDTASKPKMMPVAERQRRVRLGYAVPMSEGMGQPTVSPALPEQRASTSAS